jgi:HPt (histidine-containing phosphotransfer) domain-containing protein
MSSSPEDAGTVRVLVDDDNSVDRQLAVVLLKRMVIDADAAQGQQGGRHDGAPVLDRDGLLERSMDDPELAREVLDTFLKECAELSAALSQALSATDPQASYAAAHSLKGAAGNAGAVRVRDIAKDIEGHARAGDRDAAISRLGDLATQLERFRARAFTELAAPGRRGSGAA